MNALNRLLFTSLFIALAAQPVSATADSGLQSLERFIQSASSGRADFVQVVTSPPKEGQAARSKTTSGSFEFQRPNRFRFVYKKPFEQTIVSDGQTLWLHDVDLNQVSSRPLGQALQGTPAVILSSGDLAALKLSFNLENGPDKNGLRWVLATPRSQEGSLQALAVGFKNGELATLEILDSFGQRSVMSFSAMVLNPALPGGSFNFKPPAGVDVIKQ